MTTKKRIVSLMMTVIMMLSCTMLSSATAFAAEYIGTAELSNARLSNVLEDQLEEMVSNSNYLRGDDVTLEIAQISKISDFDGNTYTLVECSPQGYMIANKFYYTFGEWK